MRRRKTQQCALDRVTSIVDDVYRVSIESRNAVTNRILLAASLVLPLVRVLGGLLVENRGHRPG